MRTNKGFVMGIIMLIAICLTPIMVSASASFEVTDSFSAESPMFGDSDQEASNPEHETESKRVQYDTIVLNINNTGDEDLSNFTATFTPDSTYSLLNTDITVETGETTIQNGTTGQIQLKGKIPEDLDAVNDTYHEVGFLVGTLTLSAKNETGSVVNLGSTINVYMQRENKLYIDDLDAIINDESPEDIDDNEDIENLKPGDNVDLQITLENIYNSKSDLSIDDIEIEIVCEDTDEELDFDDESLDGIDLDYDDTTEETMEFSIEDDADRNSGIGCTLSIIGTDENGADHGEFWSFDVEIDRDSDDIIIKDIRLSPSVLTCDDSSFQIAVDIRNLGRSDEDRAAVQVVSSILGLDEKVTDLDLEKDDDATENFIFSIDTNTIAEGLYALQVFTFTDNTDQSNTDVVQIENMCTNLNEEETTEEETTEEEYVDAITMEETTVSAVTDKMVSIKVQLTNTGSSPVDYTVALENLEEFATSTSSKNVHLNPGQTSTVFLNMKTNEDVEEEGMYTANVVLTETATGSVLETETFTVDFSAEEGETTSFDFNTDSKTVMVLVNLLLVIIAIVLIRLIFKGGKNKKAKTKKVADLGAKGSLVLNKKKK